MVDCSNQISLKTPPGNLHKEAWTCISNDSPKGRELVSTTDASSGLFVLYAAERQVDAWPGDARFFWNSCLKFFCVSPAMISKLP
jgi:hypothetical protein